MSRLIIGAHDERLRQIAFDAMLDLDIKNAGPWTGPIWWYKVGETND